MKFFGRDRGTSNKWFVAVLSFPLVGNPSDLYKILKKDFLIGESPKATGQAGMTTIMNINKTKEDL
jgi:hypothetical protein